MACSRVVPYRAPTSLDSSNPTHTRYENAIIPITPCSRTVRHGPPAFCAQSTAKPAVSGSEMGTVKLPSHHRQVSFVPLRAPETLQANSSTATAGTEGIFRSPSTRQILGTMFHSCRICDISRTRRMLILWLWIQEIALKVMISTSELLASCELWLTVVL